MNIIEKAIGKMLGFAKNDCKNLSFYAIMVSRKVISLIK
jgi:hypothetical protein